MGKMGAAGGILQSSGLPLGCIAGLSSWAGRAVARQLVPLCSCSRYTSAEAAEVIHHPHSLLSTLLTAVLVWVFFSLRGIESGKAFTGTLVLLQVSG